MSILVLVGCLPLAVAMGYWVRPAIHRKMERHLGASEEEAREMWPSGAGLTRTQWVLLTAAMVPILLVSGWVADYHDISVRLAALMLGLVAAVPIGLVALRREGRTAPEADPAD